MEILVNIVATPKSDTLKIKLEDINLTIEEWENLPSKGKQSAVRDFLTYTTNQPHWEVESFN